jgi:hypothetical protein
MKGEKKKSGRRDTCEIGLESEGKGKGEKENC